MQQSIFRRLRRVQIGTNVREYFLSQKETITNELCHVFISGCRELALGYRAARAAAVADDQENQSKQDVNIIF